MKRKKVLWPGILLQVDTKQSFLRTPRLFIHV